MGLLDDAIREHLDLKRRSGGDPAEIERLEREALGPVRREPSVFASSTAVAEEPPAHASEAPSAEHDPLPHETPALGGYGEQPSYPSHDELPVHDEPVRAPEQPQRRPRRFLRGLSALSGAPAEDERHDEPPARPAPAERTRPAPPPREPPPLALSGETHHDEPEPEPEPAASAPAAHPEVPADEQATQVHRIVEPAAPVEPERPETASAPEPAEAPAPAEDEGDPLEETPEFLQDTPEHDRLWFEQRPPRDFDFDG